MEELKYFEFINSAAMNIGVHVSSNASIPTLKPSTT